LWDKNGSTDIIGVIDRFLGVTFDIVNPIGRKIGVWWDRCYSSPSGSLYSERDGFLGKVHCRLSISGEACTRVGNRKLRGFALWCQANLRGLKCSRIDLAVDDYSQMLEYDQIKTALEQGQYAGFKMADCVKNYGSKWHGWTIYLGRRLSDKFVRIYDKYAESKGQIKATRWETEYKHELANKVFAAYLEFPEDEAEFQSKIVDIAIGGVAFVDKKDKNIIRCSLLDWWREWLAFLQCSPFRVRTAKAETSINKKQNWLSRSVVRSLALVKDAIGEIRFEHFLDTEMAEARLKYTNMDELILRDYFAFAV
jgi:DNA relaxase NicK